jgi:hypothetical protein
MRLAAAWLRCTCALVVSFSLAASAAAIVEVPSGTSVRFEWAPAEGSVASYFVYRIDAEGRLQYYAMRPAAEPWTLLHGTSGAEYALQVVAISENGDTGLPSETSEYVRFVTADVPPPTEEPPTEEPPTEEPPTEEPPTEEPPAEEPPTEEPPTEEPPTEEPPTEEPSGGAPPPLAYRAAGQPLDFDGDGGTELLLRHETSGELVIWYVDGATPVRVPVEIGPLSASERVVGNADYDGNGHADVVVQDETSGELRIHFLDSGAPIGMLAFRSINSDVIGSEDFDGDGAADLVLEDFATGDVEVWPNLYTEGSEEVLVIDSLQSRSEVIGASDLDGDGSPDLLVRERRGKITGYSVEPDGHATRVVTYARKGWQIGALCDMNRDGRMEVLARRRGRWAWLDADGDSQQLPRNVMEDGDEVMDAGPYHGGSSCDILLRNSAAGEFASLDTGAGWATRQALGAAPTGWVPVGVRYLRP